MSMATGIPNLIPTVDKHNIVEIITNGKKKMDDNYFFAKLRTLRSSEAVHPMFFNDGEFMRSGSRIGTWRGRTL